MEKTRQDSYERPDQFVEEKLAYLVAYQIKHWFALQSLTLGWELLAMSGDDWHGEDG